MHDTFGCDATRRGAARRMYDLKSFLEARCVRRGVTFTWLALVKTVIGESLQIRPAGYIDFRLKT